MKSILKLNAIPNPLFNSSGAVDLVPVDIIADIISDQEYLIKHPILHIVLNDRITWSEIIELLGKKDKIKKIGLFYMIRKFNIRL